MTAAGRVTPVGSGRCPARARELAARLSALFTHDVTIVERLNDAHGRLDQANERLCSCPPPGELTRIYWSVRDAFCDYQNACEERRQLAIDVGELTQQLIEVLGAGGFSEKDARSANVHELGRGSQVNRDEGAVR